jgi:hypothetical protein
MSVYVAWRSCYVEDGWIGIFSSFENAQLAIANNDGVT